MIEKNEQSIFRFIQNSNISTLLGISFLKWVFISSIVGTLTGIAATLFLKSLEA